MSTCVQSPVNQFVQPERANEEGLTAMIAGASGPPHGVCSARTAEMKLRRNAAILENLANSLSQQRLNLGACPPPANWIRVSTV